MTAIQDERRRETGDVLRVSKPRRSLAPKGGKKLVRFYLGCFEFATIGVLFSSVWSEILLSVFFVPIHPNTCQGLHISMFVDFLQRRCFCFSFWHGFVENSLLRPAPYTLLLLTFNLQAGRMGSIQRETCDLCVQRAHFQTSSGQRTISRKRFSARSWRKSATSTSTVSILWVKEKVSP